VIALPGGGNGGGEDTFLIPRQNSISAIQPKTFYRRERGGKAAYVVIKVHDSG
jgi:hypothetical protein